MAASAASASASLTLKSAWSRLASYPSQHPMAFGIVLSGFKTSFSDLLVQKVVERKEHVDWKRNATFATFGFVYLGGIQYALYVPIFGRLFPNAANFAAKSLKDKLKDVRGMMTLGAQVFLDQCLHHPLVYFPAFYCTKELVMSEKPDLPKVLSEYRTNMSEDLAALWKVWVPATVINFAFMPMHFRIPFAAGVSLLWTMILSAMRGGDVAHKDDLAGGAVTGATMKIVQEGLDEYFTCPVELDRDMTHVCVTASGPDKVGLVATLARAVASEGGNVTYSNMVRLGQEFIILMHVAVPPEQKRPLVSSLAKNKELKALNIRSTALNRRFTGTYEKAVMGLRIHCVGEDKPGMLASIAERIVEKGMSVENVSTELRMDKGGHRVFVVEADCTTAALSDKENVNVLVSDLSTLKEELGLDVMDIRVHTA